MKPWMTSLCRLMVGIVLVALCPMLLSPHGAMAEDIIGLITEPARDSILMKGFNPRACLDNRSPNRTQWKFHPGFRSLYGVYCVEYDENYKDVSSTSSQVIALRPDKDWHTVSDPDIEIPARKLSFDQFLQMQQIGYQLRQYYLLKELSEKFAKLQALLEKDVKAWQDESMNKVIAEIQNFPDEFSKNSALVDAVASAAGKNLSADQQFLNALKEALKK